MADSMSETDTDNISETNPNDELQALKAELEAAKRESASYRSNYETERSARLQAEQRGMSESERRIAAEEMACKSTIDGLNSEADNIEAQIATLADEPGHGKEIAALNRKLTQVTAKISAEEQRQTWLAGQREQAKTQREAQASDNSEKLANGQSIKDFAPAVQKWFKEHPKSLSDPNYLERAITAARYATQFEGHAENSPEYFQYIESQLGEGPKQPARQASPPPDDEGEDLGTTVRQPQHRAAGPGSMQQTMAAVAPPSQRAASTGGTAASRRLPMLTPDEKEVADSLYADRYPNPADRYVQYANNKKFFENRKSTISGVH